MQNFKNTKKMVKLIPQILVRSDSFGDIMNRDKYVAFKIVSCSRSGNFLSGYQNSYSDIFNTFVDMMQHKLSRTLHWKILAKLNT